MLNSVFYFFIRSQQEESSHELYKPPLTTAGGRAEGQTGAQRPQNHQDPHSQGFHGPYTQKGQGPHSQVFQEQNPGFVIPHIQSTPGSRPPSSHEGRDPYTHVQSRGDRSRSVEQTSVHPDAVVLSMPAQGQVPPTHSPVHLQPQAPPTSASHTSPRHHSDSAALHWDHRELDRDREHPLTRLEIALAEVQRGTSSDGVVFPGSHGDNSFDEGGHGGPVRSLSVLEKVSRFERRERAGKQRSHSTSNAHNKVSHLRATEKGGSAPCGADDLRNMLERSTDGTKAHRTLSYRGSSSDHMRYRTQADPSSALQRSRSSFQLDESSEGHLPRRQDIQEALSTNRSYRDSLKDVMSKVLRSTSFRRRDLSTSSSPPPVSSSSSHQPPPVPAKYHSLEKKGPKTMPKPQGIIIAPQSPPPPPLVTSPHTPKERHVVSPEIRGASPPALPNVPPVGPPALLRICGRKRLLADQKKRSYSEPENMNEVGVLDTETVALFRRGGETSVADRRKMFERAASHGGGGSPQNAAARPDLRQLQHDALAEYIERKRGVRRDGGGEQRSGPRPRSANDSVPERSLSGERRPCSTLPPVIDLRNHQSNLFYPGRVTSPRPPALPPHSAPPDSPPEPQTKILQDLAPDACVGRRSQSVGRDPGTPGHRRQAEEPQLSLGLSRQLNGALQRAGSNRSSGKSASAEDLLERSEQRRPTPQHSRSRSSSTVETVNQGHLTVYRVAQEIPPNPQSPVRCQRAGASGWAALSDVDDGKDNTRIHRTYDIHTPTELRKGMR
ncbi:hypothetical protein F2P81_025661 [Scophthalmus maximus]|uniref:ASD1 domain-containing protein n=1 Tax=Scophthalmus maximus TaxID=52904 RepID=A0A6A4RHY7_SCOMX|nr:hypothetical protein F2P81_025661 [Scophthalmus maximus]